MRFSIKQLPPEDLKKKHNSILRNSLIGKCFFLIKYIGEWGTGTNRIIELCSNHGLPEPVFEVTSGSLVITLREEITEELLREKGLNDRQIKAVNYLKENGRIRRKTYCNIYEVGKTLAYEELNEMVEKGIIKRRGKGRGTYYILKTKRTINERLTDDSPKKGENI